MVYFAVIFNKKERVSGVVRLMDLEEGVDWYRDPDTGCSVWTAKFLLERGFCCHGGCRHCPYDESGRVRPEHAPALVISGVPGEGS